MDLANGQVCCGTQGSSAMKKEPQIPWWNPQNCSLENRAACKIFLVLSFLITDCLYSNMHKMGEKCVQNQSYSTEFYYHYQYHNKSNLHNYNQSFVQKFFFVVYMVILVTKIIDSVYETTRVNKILARLPQYQTSVLKQNWFQIRIKNSSEH